MTTFSGRAATTTALLALLLTGCGAAASDGTGSGGADRAEPATPERARLVRADRDPTGRADVATGRAVEGVLRVNEAGCYAVGRAVAIAPRGSLALGDGLGVHLQRRGDLRTGDRVDALAARVTDVRRLPTYAGCVDAGTRGVVVLG